jgi:hypothetical protein
VPGVDAMAFGDLFLRDVRPYRDKQLARTGLEPLFSLWDEPTDHLARAMIDGGLRARLACIDPKQLPASYAGRDFDATIERTSCLASIPAANAESFIPAFTPGQCSGHRSGLNPDRSSSGMASLMPISSKWRRRSD